MNVVNELMMKVFASTGSAKDPCSKERRCGNVSLKNCRFFPKYISQSQLASPFNSLHLQGPGPLIFLSSLYYFLTISIHLLGPTTFFHPTLTFVFQTNTCSSIALTHILLDGAAQVTYLPEASETPALVNLLMEQLEEVTPWGKFTPRNVTVGWMTSRDISAILKSTYLI